AAPPGAAGAGRSPAPGRRTPPQTRRAGRDARGSSRARMVGVRPPKIKEVCYSPASMPFDTAARILSHDALNSDHFLLTLDAPRMARASRPGQFVMLQAQPGRDPLLRRPMSVCGVAGSPPRRL